MMSEKEAAISLNPAIEMAELWQYIAHDSIISSLLFVMLLLASIDLYTFVTGRAIDCKSIIISTGLIGTFIGIFNGLWGFDPNDIAKSVPALLQGLKLAFVTSIIGMLISLFLVIAQILLQTFFHGKFRRSEQQETVDELELIKQSLMDIKNADVFSDVHQVLQNMQTELVLLRQDIYQSRKRFVKIDEQGIQLKDDAQNWTAVQDNETRLIWEVKTEMGERGCGDSYSSEESLLFVEWTNNKQLANISNWRLPEAIELKKLFFGHHLLNPFYFQYIHPETCVYACNKQVEGDDAIIGISFNGGEYKGRKFPLMLVSGEVNQD
jgi:hypothetical protein